MEERALHFSRVTAFEDKFDGALNCVSANDHYDITDEGKIIRIEESSLDSRSALNSETYKGFAKNMHARLLSAIGVSCWQLNQSESHAMWRVFGKSDHGIAIRSTLDGLAGSLTPGAYKLLVGRVRYIDYSSEKIPLDNHVEAFLYKSDHFKDERELRLLCYRSLKDHTGGISFEPLPEAGLLLPVDLTRLVHGILVSPYAPAWFDALVRRTMDRHGLRVPVCLSEIRVRKA